MKYLALMLIMVASSVFAQPRPDLTPGQANDMRQWNGQDRIPHWCRGYDRRDYWRERRACGDDRRCLHDVRRKAERCGLR